MAAQPRTKDQVIQRYGRIMLITEIHFLLNKALQSCNRPHLDDQLCVCEPLEGDLKKYGDYQCTNILSICEILRAKDPNLFDKRGPRSIAKDIMENFPQSEMIKGLTLHDVGILTFKLNGDWMAKRIHKNLKDGIAAWAPISLAKWVIVDFPTPDTAAEMHADVGRSRYIRDTLVRMLEYCGVEVSSRMLNTQSLLMVKSYFPEEKGVIRSRRKSEPPLFVSAEPNNVHEDLAALWCGINVQQVEWILYVTPVRQREYVMKCFTAAREFAYGDPPTMSYLGYQTSSNEQRKLASLWNKYDKSYIAASLVDLYGGYSAEAILECALKYTYLKKHRFCDCTLNVHEMLDAQGNTFVYLLNTQALIRSVIKKSQSGGMSKLNKALVGKERELGLRLLQFTEVIEESFLTLMPHLVCDYLWSLSKNLTFYIREVRPNETKFLLCKAAEVVMEKCFDLLGITPELSGKLFPLYLERNTDNYSISCSVSDVVAVSDARPKNSTSRFEMFSMFIVVSHSNFEKGNLFGNITLSDTYGLLPDSWCKMDENDCGHISYFDHDWHDSVGIYSTSFLSFGNPNSLHSVPFSSSIEIGVHLYVTTKKKDACYQLCNYEDEINLLGFWNGEPSIERGTFYVEGKDGSVSIYYILLKDAVDTSMRLTYEPLVGDPRVCGRIFAYYGGDTINSCVGFEKESYKALVFHIESSNKLKKGNLQLKKSALAVPTNGVLVIEAFLKDADSGEIIVKGTRRYRAEHEGNSSKWVMEGTNCRFNLTVDWIRGQGCN